MALRDKQKEKLRRWIRVTMVFIAVLLLLFAVGVPIINNAVALKVEKDLKALSLPPDTTLVETTSKAGRMVGNSNGMQYFGAALIKSDLSLEELRTYYAEYDCVVMAQTSAEMTFIDGLSYRHQDYDGHYYTVYRWGSAPSWLRDLLDTDLRGH